MYKIIGLLIDYGIPAAGVISLFLLTAWDTKISKYLKLKYPDIHKKIYIVEQDDNRAREERSLFSEFIAKKHLELDDPVLSEIIYKYKIFKFSILMFMLLFIANMVIAHH